MEGLHARAMPALEEFALDSERDVYGKRTRRVSRIMFHRYTLFNAPFAVRRNAPSAGRAWASPTRHKWPTPPRNDYTSRARNAVECFTWDIRKKKKVQRFCQCRSKRTGVLENPGPATDLRKHWTTSRVSVSYHQLRWFPFSCS